MGNMKLKLGLLALMAMVLLLAVVPAYSASTEELERKIDLLSDEVDDLIDMGANIGTTDNNRVSVHGYGEMRLSQP